MPILSYPAGSQPLICSIPPHQPASWYQRQQQQQPLPPDLAVYYHQAGYCQGATQLSPPQQQQQQFANRPYDLGYESDTKEQQQQQHLLQQQQNPPYLYPHPGQQPQAHLLPPAGVAGVVAAPPPSTPLTKPAVVSPGGSTCDSARAESPADAQLAEVASDLEGFSLAAGGHRPVDMALSQTMEVVWHQRFDHFFSRFPRDTWHLTPVFDQPDLHNTGIAKAHWRYFKDQAKVRFICTSCQKAWTSMGGQVIFWIYRDPTRNAGYVSFKLYGQKCSDCCPEYYEHAIWYQEEVEKVVENLFQHVGQLYYGYQPQRRRVDRRAGQPRKEHSTATCQACQENVCRMGQVLRKKMRTELAA